LVVIPYHFRNKDELRKWLWKYLSDYHLTMVPRPCFARIPSFKATHVATARLTKMEPWQRAATVLISADDATEDARREALKAGKTVVVPVPRTDQVVVLDGVALDQARPAAMVKEMQRFGTAVPIAEAPAVDMVVLGALSVDRYGNWLGQGDIFGEIPPALIATDGPAGLAPRVALVDDMQIFEDFGYLMTPTDHPMDYLVTKTQILSPQQREIAADPGPFNIL